MIMKPNLLSAIFLFASATAFCQIPSINETKSQTKDGISQKAFNVLNRQLVTVKREKQNLENLSNEKKDSIVNVNEKIIEKSEEIATLEKLINQSTFKNYESHFNLEIEKINDEIRDLENKHKDSVGNFAIMEKIEKRIETKRAELLRMEQKRDEKLGRKIYPTFFPSVRESSRNYFFEKMYNNSTDKTNYVNSFALSGDSDGATAQTEIITDNISALRISFGSVITANSNNTEIDEDTNIEEKEQKETEQDAFKRLVNGGGNFYLEFILPLISTNNENEGWITSYTYANFKGAMDIKGFGNNLDTSAGNGALGINSYLGASSDNGKFNFFIQGNINYSIGTDEFYENLGLGNKRGFLNGKFILGLALLNTFKVSAIVSTFGSDEKVRNEKVMIGVQILPNL